MPAKSEKVPYESALQMVSESISDTLTDKTGLLQPAFAHLKTGKGKYIRTHIGLACASDAEQMVPVSVVPSLTAIELLHLATLVHDDVIDCAKTRRGVPTLHTAFDSKTAILTGDYIFTLCFSLTAGFEGENLCGLAKAIAGICKGELRQNRNLCNYDLTVREYLKIISGKTALLFSLSAMAGARSAGYTGKELTAIANVGYRLGMLFQMTDDKIDLEQDTGTSGKDCGRDLASGVVTLPVILALRRSPGLRARLDKGGLSPAVMEVVRQGICDADRIMGRYQIKARRLMDGLSDFTGRDALLELMEKICTRTR